jgi:hypothetical protein
LAQLEKNHSDLQVTMSTLHNISLPIPEQLSSQSKQLSDIIAVLDEVEKAGVEIKKISIGVQQLQRKAIGNFKVLNITWWKC